ncbi:MAG: tetratricopeptide repeat protein [Bacteroidales bacterium]|jgi:tetratricopeptide (TPR) repeat protein/DNA-binding MarR family transcriptional regulator|nr:tetratricopeptide repeat protein [Bacteroidales bacterium]
METAVSLSHIGLYNPQRQSAELTEKLFVVRKKQFKLLMERLNEEENDSIPQHHLILAQRGMGKTTMLKRIEVELHKEQYRSKFIPVLFTEEQYGLNNLAKFWMNSLNALADSLEVEDKNNSNVAEIDNYLKQIAKEKNTDNFAERLYQYLLTFCNKLKRRPVLLVDNIGLVFNRLSEQEKYILRGYITEKNCPIIISAGIAMAGNSDVKEHITGYTAPYYDFFQTHYLKKLSFEEFETLFQNLAEVTQTNIFITSKEKPRLKSLLQLTGGNPRTSVILFKLLVKGFSADIVDDLEALADEMTPLYKSRFEELSTQQQQILYTIALNWDSINLAEIHEATGLANNQLSPQLKRLIEDGWLETTKAYKAKGNAYYISERFFSIWHLLRNSTRSAKREINYLSKFLENFFGKKSLSEGVKSILNMAYIDRKSRKLALILSNVAVIPKKMKERLNTKLMFEIKTNNYFKQDECLFDFYKKGMLCQFKNLISDGDKYQANKILHTIGEDNICCDSEILLLEVYCEIHFENYKKAEKAAREAIEKNKLDTRNWCLLGCSLLGQRKYNEAEQAFLHSIALDDEDIRLLFCLSRFYVATKQKNKAEKIIEKIMESGENNSKILFEVSELYTDMFDYYNAEKILKKIISIKSNYMCGWCKLGQVCAQQDKYDEAEKALKKTVGLKKKNCIVAYQVLSSLYIKMKRYDEAEKAIEKIVTLDRNNAFVWNTVGDIYVAMKNYEKAEQAYKQAISLDENEPQLWFGISQLYINTNRHNEAEKAIQKFLELDKENVDAWNVAGELFFEMKKYNEVERAYRQAIELDETNLRARFGLSILYMNLSHFDEADVEIQEIVKLDTDNRNAGVIGRLYFNYDRYIEAENFLQQAVDLNKGDAVNWYQLGQVLSEQDKYSEAENAFGKAVELEPENSYYWCFYGVTLFFQYEYAGAEKAFRRAIELDKNQENIFNWQMLGITLSNLEKKKDAIETFNKAIELAPNDANGYMLLGKIYEDMTELEKAAGCYTESINIDPNDETVYRQRGYTYSMLGESSKAIEDYTKAIELNPNSAIAYSDRGWEYAYIVKDYDKAVADYTKAIEFDKDSNAGKHLLHLYRDIKNQFDKAEEIFEISNFPENVKCLEQTLFELHRRNEGIAKEHLSKALSFIENGFKKDMQSSWEYFAAITVKTGHGQWLLDILKEEGYDIILSPYYIAIQYLEIGRAENVETAEIYLKNQAVEKSEPAGIIIENMNVFL